MGETTIQQYKLVLMPFCYLKYLSFSQTVQILLLQSWPFYMNQYKIISGQ